MTKRRKDKENDDNDEEIPEPRKSEEIPEPRKKKRRRKSTEEPSEKRATEEEEPRKEKKDKSATSCKKKDESAVSCGKKEDSGRIKKGKAAEGFSSLGPRTAFVDGLPYDWTSDDIRKVFASCGKLLDLRAPTFHDSGRLLGYAHLDFETVEGCLNAVAKSGCATGVGERYLRVQAAHSTDQAGINSWGSKVAVGSTLFIKNLPYESNEDRIGKLFAGCQQVRIATEKGRNKGFAYVDFKNKKAAQKILDGGPYTLLGRTLLLCGDVKEGHKAGFHYRKEAYDSHFGPMKKKKEPLF